MHRRDQFFDVARDWKAVTLGHVENETVGENAASMQQRQSPILKGISIELIRDHSMWGKTKRIRNERNRVFEIPALHLKMVWPQIHPLRPNHFSELLHVDKPCGRGV